MNVEQVRQVVGELAAQISGARVAKIHQPSAEMLLLRLWTGTQNLKLLISAAPQGSGIQLTDESFPNPFAPPRFCQLLRARLSRILEVKQLNDDRIIELSCQGPKGECRLIIELTGRSSNLILTDSNGRIIDVLKRHKEGRNTLGGQYSLPENKPDEAAGQNSGAARIDTALLTASALDSVQPGSTDLRVRLEKLLQKELKKLTKRLAKIKQEQGRQQGFESYRQQGDLILANLYLMKRGLSEIVVANYFKNPPVDETIPLDPHLLPQENAETYFKKYKKARRGLEHSARRIAETEVELAWLEDLGYQLESSEQPADIIAIAVQLKKAGLLKDKASSLPRSHEPKSLTFKETSSPGGYKILWGINSRQNDLLSTRTLKRGDLWFHTQRCPGSHVLLRADNGSGEFADADIEYAASIAAANSKAKNDSKVEVMVAEAKAVKKPHGAKPGMVTVQQYKTIIVKPFSGE